MHTVSESLRRYLIEHGFPAEKITAIINGVDTDRFCGAADASPVQPIDGCPFHPDRHWIIGTVGRMQAVKDQLMLTRAYIALIAQAPELRERARAASRFNRRAPFPNIQFPLPAV